METVAGEDNASTEQIRLRSVGVSSSSDLMGREATSIVELEVSVSQDAQISGNAGIEVKMFATAD